MSATNNEYKTLVDEALHNYFHDTTETEMILKDWLYGVCNKAEAFDEIKGVAFWYFEVMRPNFKNSDEYESFYEVIRNELKEIESEAE